MAVRSYGGHYMPTLAQKIVNENTAATNPHLNFKGFAVGNPATTFYSTIPASIDTYWGHQLVAKPTYDKYYADCIVKARPNVIK
jgi:serine carboxypeptidase-like clade 2